MIALFAAVTLKIFAWAWPIVPVVAAFAAWESKCQNQT